METKPQADSNEDLIRLEQLDPERREQASRLAAALALRIEMVDGQYVSQESRDVAHVGPVKETELLEILQAAKSRDR